MSLPFWFGTLLFSLLFCRFLSGENCRKSSCQEPQKSNWRDVWVLVESYWLNCLNLHFFDTLLVLVNNQQPVWQAGKRHDDGFRASAVGGFYILGCPAGCSHEETSIQHTNLVAELSHSAWAPVNAAPLPPSLPPRFWSLISISSGCRLTLMALASPPSLHTRPSAFVFLCWFCESRRL